nr:hypothetical protein [Nostoc sp. 'Peltigera membranacea cyanobiont' 213]
MPLSLGKFLNAVPPQRELLTLYYLLIRSQNRKTILSYSHEERSDACGELRLRLMLASVQQIMLGHLPEKEIYIEKDKFLQFGTRIFHSFAVECLFCANYLYLTSPKFTHPNFEPMPSREQPMKTSNDIDTKKIIKKSDKLTLRQMKLIEEAEDKLIEANTVHSSAPVVEDKPVITPEPRIPDYVPFLDNPPVQSVGNSGWQVSDVWRDIRVDDFCG